MDLNSHFQVKCSFINIYSESIYKSSFKIHLTNKSHVILIVHVGLLQTSGLCIVVNSIVF